MLHRFRAPGRALVALSLPLAALLGAAPGASAQGPCDEAILAFAPGPDQGFDPFLTQIDGDRMLVGAVKDVGQSALRSAVYVFDRDPLTGQWTETQELVPSTPTPPPSYGSSLVLDGDLAIVAARASSSTGYPGRVYVFRRDPSTGIWNETQSFRDPSSSSFAWGIDYADGHLAVTDRSAPRIVMYREAPATGQFVADGRILGTPAITPPLFGLPTLILDGDTIAASDRQADVAGQFDAGRIAIYRRVGTTTTWMLAQSITAATPEAGDNFGWLEGWDGDRLYGYGSPIGNVQFYEPRPVIEYSRDPSGALVETGRIEPDTTALVRSQQLIGVPEDDVALMQEYVELAPASLVFRVRRFIRDTASGAWYPSTVLDTWQFQNAPESNEFVSRDGDRVAWTRAVRSPFAGTSRYVAIADLEECAATGYSYCAPAMPNSTGEPASLEVHTDVDDPNADVMLLGRRLPPGAPTLALVSDTTGYQVPPASAGPLCLSGAIGRHFAVPTAGSGGSVAVRLARPGLPTAVGPIAAVPGTTWSFQLWYRDPAGAQPSNLSSARTVLFR